MTDKSLDKALLPPMRLDADPLDAGTAAAVRDSRDELLQDFQERLKERRMEGLAEIAQRLADAELSLGMLDEALGSFRRAAQLLGEEGDAAVVAATQYAIAEIERSKGRFDEAQASYLEAKRCFERSEDRGAQATCLLCAGEMKARINLIGDALDSYHEALELFGECKDQHGQALTLFRIAEATSRIDRETAKKQYAEARELFDKIDKATTIEPEDRAANEPLPDRNKDLRKVEAWLMAKLCAAQASDVQFQPITDDGALHRTRKPPNRKPMLAAGAFALLVLAWALLFRSDPEPPPSEPAESVAAPAEPAVPKEIARAGSLRRVGGERLERGDTEGARQAYQMALDAYRGAADGAGQGAMLIALAKLEEHAGNVRNAREMYEESLGLLHQSRDFEGEAIAAQAITTIDEAIGNDEQLERSYARQAELCELSEKRDCQAYALEKLIEIELRRNDSKTAHTHLAHLLRVRESENDTVGTAYALERLGALELASGVRPSTRSKLERAYTLYRENDDVDGQARSLMALGDLDMANEQPWQARATYRQVLGILGEDPTPQTHRDALVKLATAEKSLGQEKRAAELFEEALATCATGEGDECRAEIQGRIDALEQRS